jgi:hypothetical protein
MMHPVFRRAFPRIARSGASATTIIASSGTSRGCPWTDSGFHRVCSDDAGARVRSAEPYRQSTRLARSPIEALDRPPGRAFDGIVRTVSNVE